MLKFQRYDYDISLRFRVDNIHEFFEPSIGNKPQRRVTDFFGPGWQLELKMESEKDDEWLCMWFKIAFPETLRFSTNVASLTGIKCYHSGVGTISPGDRKTKLGFRGVLSRSKHWGKNRTLGREDAVVVSFTITSIQGPSATADPTLDVLYRLIAEEKGRDTGIKFITYCTRRLSGRLSDYEEFYASLPLLMTHCNFFFDFVTGELSDLMKIVLAEDDCAVCQTDYVDSDSDFGDEVDDEVDEEETEEDLGEKIIPKASTGTEEQKSNPAENEMAVDGPDETNSVSAETVKVSTEPDKEVPDTRESLSESSESRPVIIVVNGAASATWEALLFYLYTGTVEFAPLTSIGSDRQHSIDLYKKQHPNRPAPCSCKSIYRLADKLELEHLKKLALQHLEWQLTSVNILAEIFTAFTSRYEEVKKMELAVLTKHWNGLKDTPAFKASIKEAFGKPHASQIILDIFERLSMQRDSIRGEFLLISIILIDKV